MKYFFHIAYDGSKYSGWQWQPNSFSIQEEIEQKLEKIFKDKITVYGCGRTDKGVHASQYFFHIDLKYEPYFDIQFVLRQHLPPSITLFDVIKVDAESHCRYDASSRSYDYFLHTNPDPFLNKYSTLFNYEKLDFSLMKKAASLISNYKDFRSFCLQPEEHNHTLCEISSSKIYIDENGSRLRFSISGNRFLKGMNRILMGALLKVGRGQINVLEFEDYFKEPRDAVNIKVAPPNGLYLSKVDFPYIKSKNQSQLFNLLKKDLL